jgi:thiol:disulfide interchange protein
MAARFDWTDFLIALGAALLGGLLLNLMPCVFPMISLKAMSLVRTGSDDRAARIEAIGYATGAIGTIAAMGAALLMLRRGGAALGWAFQLQDPRVVTGLLLLIIAIATNMAGLFELPSMNLAGGPASSGYWGSISTGALAAFIATPCTGPFMAGALGAAMILPTPAAMAVFVGLGIGLALPFLCLGFFKPLRRWVPRPGPWMTTFRHLLSLPMFATALGLAWILGRQVGLDGLMQALAAALLLGLALWWYGLRQRAGKHGHMAAIAAFFAVIGALFWVPAGGPAKAASIAPEKDALMSEPFSETRLQALRSEGRPVFLYLTADWCLTCKVNEATSLANADVAKAFARHNVAVLRGDWTRQDPAISRYLKAQGRAGVPLYLWFRPGGEAQELPQVLSPDMLEKLLVSKGRKVEA